MVSSCYTRKLNDGEYLLDKNKIITNNDKVDKGDLKSVISQRPNKKIFSVVKFHLMLHNSMDSLRVANRELKKVNRNNKRIKRRNLRKVKRQKDTIAYRKSNKFDSFGERLLYSIGEKPTILDEEETNKTAYQLHLYLIRKGFFNNNVRDSIKYIDRKFLGLKKKRAEVFYIVDVLDPYLIKTFEIKSKDALLLSKVNKISSESLIKTDNIFDVDVLDDERDRITTFLMNDGYYKFNKNYIKFYVDSNVGGNRVSIVMDIDLFKEKLGMSDSASNSNHKQYKISKVKINYIEDRFGGNNSTFLYNEIDFFITGKNDINSNLFYNSLFLKPGDLYSKQKQQQTFRKLTSLGVFLTVNILTEIDTIENSNGLVLTIKLERGADKYVKTELTGTTSGDNFGIEGSFEYNIKNVFRGAELLHFGVTGALESQPLLINDNTTDNSNVPLDIQSFSNISTAFNTVEFGPEVSLTIPRLLFFNTFEFDNISNTKTIFNLSLNYQRRLNKTILDYERGIQELSYGYTWNMKNKFYHQIEPISFSAVEVRKSPEFEQKIEDLNDKLLAASFQSHVISSTRYRFVYNDPTAKKISRISLYYDAKIESAGNTLSAFYKLTNKPKDASTGNYEIVGIQFAQYMKTQHDLRMYNTINSKSSFVLRFVGGLGAPLENSSAALPFEKSFFAGGTDKTRAWKARSLGPGSYRDSTLSYDKIGEILLEGNAEYRFDLLGFLDGALFVDAGNIWLMKEDSLRPGSNFKGNTFLSQVAIGAGFGIRVDLDYFIFRLDIAYPLKNPSLVEGERWFFQSKDEYNSYVNTISDKSQLPSLYGPQINIGIGYPF